MVDSDDDGGDYAELMAEYPLDILEYANSYAFVIDMPGLDPDDVSVQVKPCVLLISGEGRRVEVEGAKYIRMERRSMSKFVRKFGLPENANTGKFTTVLRNGVLTVTVEKLPPPQPKAIEVKQEQLRSRGDERKLHIGAVDRMSMLPDELLVCILSLLSIKEATATCILCRRWRHLHTFRIKLDFDGTKVLQKALQMKSKDYFEEVRQKILRGVDGVVRLNQSSRLEKFRVVHHLIESDTHRIDNWVRFALSRKVESLELLSAQLGIRKEQYTLNLHKCNYDFNFMKKLSTQWVKVSGEAVEMLLRNCPLLEQVSIAQSEELLGLEIIKPFPTFRSLEILMCSNLSSIVVDDSNIVSFKYWGKRVNKVELVNVPLLTEIWIYETSVEDMFEMFSSVLPQLHTFKICITCFSRQNLRVFCSRFCSFVKMSNLKQLVVDISDMYYKEDLLPLIDLIKAFPGLQRFVIQEAYEKDCADDDFVEGIPTEIQMASSVDRMALKANTQLKEVEFVGYRGVSTHFELLKYLVENAIALETILVDPWGFKESDYILSFDQIPRRKYNDKIIARANALKHLVPIGINVFGVSGHNKCFCAKCVGMDVIKAFDARETIDLLGIIIIP